MRRYFRKNKKRERERTRKYVLLGDMKIINSTLTMFFLQGDTPTFDDSHAYEEFKDYFHFKYRIRGEKKENVIRAHFLYTLSQ